MSVTKSVFLFALIVLLLVDLNEGRRRYPSYRDDDDDDDDFTGQQTESLERLTPETGLPEKPQRPATGDRVTHDHSSSRTPSGQHVSQTPSSHSLTSENSRGETQDNNHVISTQEFLKVYKEIKIVEAKLIQAYIQRGGNAKCLPTGENDHFDGFSSGTGGRDSLFGSGSVFGGSRQDPLTTGGSRTTLDSSGRCLCPRGPPGPKGERGTPGYPGVPGPRVDEQQVRALVEELMPTMCQRHCSSRTTGSRRGYLQEPPKMTGHGHPH